MTKRSAGEYFAIAVLILLGLIVAFVIVPVYKDRKTQAVVTTGVSVAMQVAKRVQDAGSVRDALERLPSGSKNALSRIGTLELTQNGGVRLVFTAPEDIEGKTVEVTLIRKSPDKFAVGCRAPGFRAGQLPANCREGADPIPATRIE